VRIAWSKEDQQAKREAALDYQDALTKAGKPRKRPANQTTGRASLPA
jgi:hypothetical protein